MLENMIANAIDNADPKAVAGPNGLQLLVPPLDEMAPQGLTVVLHGDFVSVGYEGDSDTYDASDPNEAAKLVVASLVSFGFGA